jgi:hypothetical protein
MKDTPTPTQARCIAAIRELGPMTNVQIAAAAEVPLRTVEQSMLLLRKVGKVKILSIDYSQRAAIARGGRGALVYTLDLTADEPKTNSDRVLGLLATGPKTRREIMAALDITAKVAEHTLKTLRLRQNQVVRIADWVGVSAVYAAEAGPDVSPAEARRVHVLRLPETAPVAETPPPLPPSKVVERIRSGQLAPSVFAWRPA